MVHLKDRYIEVYEGYIEIYEGILLPKRSQAKNLPDTEKTGDL